VSLFLLIETSSDVCSVAVADDTNVLAKLENNSRDHSAQLAPMIKEAMQQARSSYKELACIGINGGPGSYTGLRIGLSTAKGLCYAANVPLVMVDSLLAYANGLVVQHNVDASETIIATVENRRDELFYAVFDNQLNRLQALTLTAADDATLVERLGGNCIVVGSATNKLRSIYPDSGSFRYVDVNPSAINLLKPVTRMFGEKQFADLAYSEPFYYKEVYIASNKTDA
jgi:tRNA threonylcarbamoyladenosine biosynthesis protein TsaB